MLDAFGVGPEVVRLPGGQGTSWRAGDLVLKPGGGPAHEWLGESLAGVALPGVRVGVPVPTVEGTWSVEGWAGTAYVEGRDPDLGQVESWSVILDAGRAFHRAVAHLSRPEFLGARTDSWGVGDRVAWGEESMEFLPEFAEVASRLADQPAPPGEPQVVHGDLTRNVLVAEGLPPAVIDLSPYWRPPSYAEGVVIADALCSHPDMEAVLLTLDVPIAAVARALLFRVATSNALAVAGNAHMDPAEETQRFDRAARALGL